MTDDRTKERTAEKTMTTEREHDIPETDAQWFELIEPEIDTDCINVDPDTATTIAEKHAKQVVEITGMDVNLARVNWEASWELKKKHGYLRRNTVKLSLYSLEANGWQQFMQVVRHELIHVWQRQNHCYNSGKNHWKRTHGQSFERWIPVLNVTKRGGQSLPTWSIECPSCDEKYEKRKQNKNQIARWLKKNDNCPICGADLEDCEVKIEDTHIEINSFLAGRDIAVPSEEQKQVFLYNNASLDDESHVEWKPRTVSLTSFHGIGDKYAVELGDEIVAIDDMVSDGELADTVRNVTGHHSQLETEVLEKYNTAMENRGESDLESLDKAITHADINWWKQIECIGETGEVEKMLQNISDEIETNDRLQLKFKNSNDEYHAKIVDRDWKKTKLTVDVENPSNGIGPMVRIELPQPHTGELPKFWNFEGDLPDFYRLDPPDGHLTSINIVE